MGPKIDLGDATAGPGPAAHEADRPGPSQPVCTLGRRIELPRPKGLGPSYMPADPAPKGIKITEARWPQPKKDELPGAEELGRARPHHGHARHHPAASRAGDVDGV